MTENKFPLGEILRMQYRFATLYSTTGLISICDDYIHVKVDTLARLSPTETWTVTISLKMTFPIQCVAMIEGIEFHSVCTRKEAEEVGLVLTAAQLILLDERKS